MTKVIIFDRDGDIIDSESINNATAVQAFEKVGIKISKEEHDIVTGRHPVDYIKYFEKQYSFSVADFLKYQKETYYKLFSSVKLIDSTISLIKELKAKGYKLALTTSSHLDSTKIVLKKANIEKAFEVIVTFDDCNKRKPDPEPYLITAKKLDIKPSDCLVVEDSKAGLESAKSAGMKCVIILNEYTKEVDFSQADFVVSDAEEIKNLVYLKKD